MALLCAGVDSDRLQLIGRWRSDEMFRYLNVQAQLIMNGRPLGRHARRRQLPPHAWLTLPTPAGGSHPLPLADGARALPYGGQ